MSKWPLPAHIDADARGRSIRIELSRTDSSHEIAVRILREGMQIGEGTLLLTDAANGCFTDIFLEKGARRQGIGTAVYDAIEAAGVKLSPSDELDEEGLLFWDNRLGGLAANRAIR